MPLPKNNIKILHKSATELLEEGDELATPWAHLGQRWGHPWHAMCSYLGTFPAALSRSMISLLSRPGERVMDPFSGRGTTLLEARLSGRHALVSDLNPMAVALSHAKNAEVTLERALAEIDLLKSTYDRLMHLPEAQVQPDNILLIYSPETLAQLCYLRRKLVKSSSDVRAFLLGALLGVMHGAERTDGTSAYASISMPNTFSMSPNYVRRFVETNQLTRAGRDVFEILAAKVERIFKDASVLGLKGVVVPCDAKKLSECPELAEYLGTVKLVVTSPPYLGVINYAKQNWIRNWLLQKASYYGMEVDLDDDLTLGAWLDFVEVVIDELKKFLTPDGVVVLVIGDVAKANKSHLNLARHLIQRLEHDKVFSYIGAFDDRMGHEIKTTRIWKDTKGKATSVDRILVLANRTPVFNVPALIEDLAVGVDNTASLRNINAETLAAQARVMAGTK
ncbi:MAG: DNA methyltransferase [Burkholderiales bacterium]